MVQDALKRLMAGRTTLIIAHRLSTIEHADRVAVLDHGKLAEISIVGSGIASTPGVAARMFKALAKQGINIDLISSSEVRITCVIDEKRIPDAARALHQEFKLEKLRRGLAKK